MFASTSCEEEDFKNIKDQRSESADVATAWADMTLKLLNRSNNPPTYNARILGYIGLTMYECAVHADPSKKSLVGQLEGLDYLPVPIAATEHYWPLVVHAGQETIIKLIFGSRVKEAGIAPQFNELSINILKEKSHRLPQATVERSLQLGKDIAEAIFAWSEKDGGKDGRHQRFEDIRPFPKGPSYWIPPQVGQTPARSPMHPQWGNNRTFAKANGLIPIPAILPYSTNPNSEYYKVYKEVYDKNVTLTQAEKEIAAWWSDDPSETYSPAGHSYNLATLTIKQNKASLVKAAETYARVGMAVADAFICCWKAKMTYFNERPQTYINANIDPKWHPFWPEPPFPAFPSGHSTQSAATATVLTDLFGESFAFEDNTHNNQDRGFFAAWPGETGKYTTLIVKTRSYKSFWETAEESAYSRFLGGIHTRQDNEVGLSEGKKIGTNINKLTWNN
ncbi:vanadium-dependent haloperoxidase [Adhaeribacter aquaticus]|uniref:vanadium-dependent haloperoxidase n=1 Tax=Adhaeribacter aquaticus TaxID=299567 RepID=UPI001B7FA77B|nr:vanadium-dependent haloperoxidase [Adhaeribacter aquaticus]